MSSYEMLASCYDKLTQDVEYEEWAKYLGQHLENPPIPGKIVLDLACGTGSLTFALAEMGYEMIGADMSEDMLAQAMEKSYEFQGQRPMFLCQSMETLDLYGTIDGCVCCLDSVNYVTEPQVLQKALERVFLFLAPGGKFLFDIKSPYAFSQQDGQFSLDESEDFYCVWRTESQDSLSQHVIDLFQKKGELWQRDQEIHSQRIYDRETMEGYLRECGFCNVQVFGNLTFSPPSPQEERLFFSAEKP